MGDKIEAFEVVQKSLKLEEAKAQTVDTVDWSATTPPPQTAPGSPQQQQQYGAAAAGGRR